MFLGIAWVIWAAFASVFYFATVTGRHINQVATKLIIYRVCPIKHDNSITALNVVFNILVTKNNFSIWSYCACNRTLTSEKAL